MSSAQSRKTTRRTLRVVVAAPETAGSKALSDALADGGYDPHQSPSPEAATLAVSYRSPAAVFLDSTFIHEAGYRLLDNFQTASPGLPVMVMAGAEEEEVRLRSLALGAEDCLCRPFAEQEAVLRLRRALERKDAMQQLQSANDETTDHADRMRHELHGLRRKLRHNMTMLQTAVQFHQRLAPTGTPEELQSTFLRNLSVQLKVDRLAYLAPTHDDSSWISVRASWGLPEMLSRSIRMQRNGELASLLVSTGSPILVERLAGHPNLRLEAGILSASGFTAAVPLLLQGHLFGIVLLGESRGGGCPPDDVLALGQFLGAALVPALAAREEWQSEHHLTAGTLGVLVNNLEARDPYLHGHSLGVARYAEAIAREQGLRGNALSEITVAALLHDVGYFEVDVAFWSKKGPLSPADWELVRKHPVEGERLLASASWPSSVVAAVRHHHERWDGTGYPSQLAGEDIPLSSRVIAVADAFEAMTRPRSYRPSMEPETALERIRAEGGTRFDPGLTGAALACLRLKKSA